MDNKQKALEQKQRLEKLVIHLKINLIDLAAMAGLDRNTIYHIGSGIRGLMSERTASRICYHLEKKLGIVVNREWLLNGTGEMIDTEHSTFTYEQDEQPLPVAAEKGADYDSPDYREKYMQLMEEYLALQKKYTTLLENKA